MEILNKGIEIILKNNKNQTETKNKPLASVLFFPRT